MTKKKKTFYRHKFKYSFPLCICLYSYSTQNNNILNIYLLKVNEKCTYNIK